MIGTGPSVTLCDRNGFLTPATRWRVRQPHSGEKRIPSGIVLSVPDIEPRPTQTGDQTIQRLLTAVLPTAALLAQLKRFELNRLTSDQFSRVVKFQLTVREPEHFFFIHFSL